MTRRRPWGQEVPGAAGLAALPLHVVVRDYPETLATLRRLGVDVARLGGGATTEAASAGDDGALLAALADRIAWRA